MNQRLYFIQVFGAYTGDSTKYLTSMAGDYSKLTSAKRKRLAKLARYATQSVAGK